jgi:RNA-directed DNA polymerase
MLHPWDSQAFAEGAKNAGRSDATIANALAVADRIKKNNVNLPVILSLGHLAHVTDVGLPVLRNYAERSDDPYRVFQVKKNHVGNAPRKHRTICVPEPSLMRVQRWIAQNVLNAEKPHPRSYAFAPCRSLVQAAERHAGCRWLIKMDLQDFFESIDERRVYLVFRSMGYGALFSFEMARLCTRLPGAYSAKPQDAAALSTGYKFQQPGFLPQGAPTSPMLANLVIRALDRRLEAVGLKCGWVYSRYADDLAFSTKEISGRGAAIALVKQVEREVRDFGLRENPAKTSITPPGHRKVLLGLLVDRDQPRLTKSFRNNVETHLFALGHPKVGAMAHCAARGFRSVTGLRRHLAGLIAFAHAVDKPYAARLYADFDKVDWSR